MAELADYAGLLRKIAEARSARATRLLFNAHNDPTPDQIFLCQPPREQRGIDRRAQILQSDVLGVINGCRIHRLQNAAAYGARFSLELLRDSFRGSAAEYPVFQTRNIRTGHRDGASNDRIR